jgi:putative membrane protein
MWHPMWDSGWGFFGLMHLVWWALLLAGAVVLLRALFGERHGGRADSALQILRERYARGEIDQAEYDERRKQLKG